MRANTAALLSIVIVVLAGALLAGCVTTTADGIQLQPMADSGGNPAAALGIDPAAYVVFDLTRSGGLAGGEERAYLYLDGHVLLERQGADPVTFQLSPAEQAQLTAALDSADFYRNAAQSQPPAEVFPDAYQYRLLRRGVLLQGEVVTQDGEAPAWLEPLLPLLTNLLLTPDPARVQPYQPAPAAAAPTATPATAATAGAPTITLLEFVRSEAGQEVRVLVNLDRTYSIARAGAIEEGELARDEMAALIQLLEAADLRTRAGDYTSGGACDNCIRYELTYRNLLGGATVRGEEGVQPEWLQALTDTLVDALIGADSIVAAPTPTAALPAATATATPASSVPTATPASPAPTATPASPAATATPASPAATATPAAPAVEPPYTTADLLADLAAQGAQVETLPGAFGKPYLAVPGVVVQVNGQPVQVFQYADAAALAVDVAGLAPNASSIGGRPLVWAAAPHFWRKGGLLALAVSNDAALVELISRVLGPQFAGR